MVSRDETQSSDRAAADEVLIERMTWPEIQAAMEGGKRTAIIVAASSEQHGPHLPEATDGLLGEAIAVRLARELGDSLVAPVIRPGCSDHHMAFPGTITIEPSVLTALLDAYLKSLDRHGFTRFVVFASHGGNFQTLADWESRLERPEVVVIHGFEGFVGAMLDPLSRFDRSDRTTPHADVTETAEMLYAYPDLVRKDRIQSGFVGEVPLQQVLANGMNSVTPNGVLGDPVGATAEMGEAVMTSLVSYLATFVRQRQAVA
jgi:creatinine amidohydrolase